MSEVVIVCRDCGYDVLRYPTNLSCCCRVGFVAQWDQVLGEGRYLGRIIDPLPTDPEEVSK